MIICALAFIVLAALAGATYLAFDRLGLASLVKSFFAKDSLQTDELFYGEDADRQAALIAIERRYAKDRNNKELSTKLASYYFELGQYEDFKRIVSEGKITSPTLLNTMAHRLALDGDIEQAEQYYQKAIEGGATGSTYVNYAYFHLNRGNLDQAIGIAQEGWQKYPTSAKLGCALASLYLKKGDKDKAKEYARAVLEFDGDNEMAKELAN